MTTREILLAVAVMAGVTYLTRALPLVLFRRRIRSARLQSFLAYLPYAVLAAMTIPAAFESAGSLPASLAGLAVACVLAWRGKGLFPVAAAATLTVFLVLLVLPA